MKRRVFLSGVCSTCLVFAGCVSDDGADTAGSEENGQEETERSEDETEAGETTDENEEDCCSSQSGHVIHFDSVEDSVDEDATVCEFDDLPSGAQVEVETAIEEGDYRLHGTSTLSRTDCFGHNTPIEWNDRYYELSISAYGG